MPGARSAREPAAIDLPALVARGACFWRRCSTRRGLRLDLIYIKRAVAGSSIFNGTTVSANRAEGHWKLQRWCPASSRVGTMQDHPSPQSLLPARFCFDVRAGATLFLDTDGGEFPDLDAAERAAVHSATKFVQDMLPQNSVVNVEVRDEHGRHVATVSAFVEIERHTMHRRRPF